MSEEVVLIDRDELLKHNGWYLTAQKRPTEDDADKDGCVLSLNLNPGDQRVTNWFWNIVAVFPENFPIWMPTPKLPKKDLREMWK